MENHIKNQTANPKPDIGWRFRLMFGLVDFLTLTGLLPSVDKITRWPMHKRQSMTLAPWIAHPPLPTAVTITERIVRPANAEPFAVRIFTPKVVQPSRPPVLYLHGGGWIAGGMVSTDYICANVADGVGTRVISVEYRLAPEFPFPAGLDDGYAALSWLAQNATEFGPSVGTIAVMGDSAGGNLVAALCVLSKQRGGPRIVHQTLIYPCLDATLQTESMGRATSGIKREQIAAMLRHYLQGDTSRENPLVSPLLAADVSGLPPAFIVTADADPLRDEGRLYAEKLSAAAVSTRYLNVLNAPHGFLSLPKLCKPAAGAMAEIVRELRALKISA